MRVLSINFFNNIRTNPINPIKTTNHNQKQENEIKLSSAFYMDTVSFGRVARNAESLRKMIKYGAPDIWTGKPPIDPDLFEQMLQRRVFNKTIKTIVKSIEPLKESLHKVPLEIFSMLEEYSKIHPDAYLDDVIRIWTPFAQRELHRLQKPVFEQLKREAEALPENRKAKFDELMQITQDQLHKRPIKQPFNKKDFRYKLQRIAQKIRQRNVSDEISAINKLIKMSEFVPSTPKSHKLDKKPAKIGKDTLQNQKTSIKQIKNFFDRSIISGDEELQVLLSDVSAQINGTPVFIPFGRLNFIEKIKNITKDLDDDVLAQRLIKTASKIPTSNQEFSAFIVKASRKPAEKIGYDWLWGCVGNIDHIDVYSKGGKDGLSNYAISTNYINSKRGNKSFAQQLRAYPEGYKTCQIYIDKLIEFANKGLLKDFGLNNAYIRNLAKKLQKRSPKEKPLILDLSELK